MSVKGLLIEGKWVYIDDEFKRMIDDVNKVKDEVHESSVSMQTDFISSARDVANLSTAYLSLEGIVTRVAAGQMNMGEAALRLIPTLVTLADALYGIVTAEKAAAVASAISQNIMSMGTLTPVILAATAIGAAVVAAMASIPEHHYTGSVPMTRPYVLAAGQYVSDRPQTGNVFNIYVNGAGDGHTIGRDIIEELKAGGYA